MLDIKNLNKAIENIATERDLDASKIKEAVEAAIASAYKKEFDRRGQIIMATLDSSSCKVKFYQVKIVVDKDSVRMQEDEVEGEEKNNDDFEDSEEKLPLYNEERHIFIEEAKKIEKDAEIDDEIKFDLPDVSEDFGRISAQTAKQVILQKIREIEKEIVKKEFEDKVGELVSGTVQRIERGNVYVDLGKASGAMYFSEAVPGEHYRIGERLRFYLLDVKEMGRTPTLLLSRTHPKFVSKLFELEVPEIADGIVVIKSIAREPGSRTKISVESTVDGVDPVGACVGQRGARVMAVNSELFNERLDIVEWSEDPGEYISFALSPANISSVEIISQNTALVLVPDDNLSLAIGKGGQNVRLAAKLTGWKIDVRPQSNPEEAQEGGVFDLEKDEDVENIDSNNEGDELNEEETKTSEDTDEIKEDENDNEDGEGEDDDEKDVEKNEEENAEDKEDKKEE